MAKVTGGERLLQALHRLGVETIFGVLDGSHNPILAVINKYGMRFVSARHEAAAVHMAEAWARVTGKPGIVSTGIGPGALNTVAGVGVAKAEGSPVIVFTGQRRRDIIDPDRGGGFQVAPLVQLYSPITKWAAGVRDWERIPELVFKAYRMATIPRQGPTYVELPEDILNEAREPKTKTMIAPDPTVGPSLGPGALADIEKVAEFLVNAERPLLHAGNGVQWAGAWEEFQALGEHLGATMTTTLAARGVVPEDHPQTIPLLDQETLVTARREADVVLAVGTQLGELDGWGLPPWWGEPGSQIFIHIDADASVIGRNRPVTMGIVADARNALQALLKAVQARTPRRQPHEALVRYQQKKKEWSNKLDQLTRASMNGINPGHMVQTVRNFFPRDAITVMDGGNTSLWCVNYNPIYSPRSFLYTAKFGHLGSGLPYAIGAKMAAPDRPVYLITGDGALGFNIQELETAARYGVAIVVVVAVDRGWGMERTSQMAAGIPQWVETELYPDTRFDLVAQGLGCHGEYVEKAEELLPALQRAVESGRPALIQVMVDPMANMAPPGIRTFAALRQRAQ